MPTYQYVCTECGDALEVQQRFTDDALTVCPACAGRLRKVFNAVGVVFKGSGFYRNDSRADSAHKNGSAHNGHNGSASGDSGKSTDSASGGSSDSSGDGSGSQSGSQSSGSGSNGSSSSSSSGSSSSSSSSSSSKSTSGAGSSA